MKTKGPKRQDIQYTKLQYAAAEIGMTLELAEIVLARGHVSGHKRGRSLWFVETSSLRDEARRLGLLSRQTV